MRVAAIDIGTNTALLLIAEDAGNGLVIVRDEHAIPRLGEGVDQKKQISPAALERLDEVLSRYRKIIDTSDVDHIAVVGTSALRDAANSVEVREHILEQFGFAVQLISGEEESRLTYRGALAGNPSEDHLIGIIDIGGGSTEIALGNGARFAVGRSMDMGAVRLTERTPSRTEREHLIREELRSTFHLFPLPSQLVGVAGTPTSLAAIKLNLDHFDRELIHGTQITQVELAGIVDILYSTSPEKLVNRYPVIPKSRVDILPAGALILLEIIRYLRAESVTVSIRGLRFGVALEALQSLRNLAQ